MLQLTTPCVSWLVPYGREIRNFGSGPCRHVLDGMVVDRHCQCQMVVATYVDRVD